MARSFLKSTILLLPILGGTWIFGLLSINQYTLIFTWLFTLLNSVQVSNCALSHNEVSDVYQYRGYLYSFAMS